MTLLVYWSFSLTGLPYSGFSRMRCFLLVLHVPTTGGIRLRFFMFFSLRIPDSEESLDYIFL